VLSGSNGDPCSDSSLHYVDPSHLVLNQYQQAILNIGSILEEYDSDQRFPVYGKNCRLYTSHTSVHYYASLNALCKGLSTDIAVCTASTVDCAATALSLPLLYCTNMS
jgi:Copine